MAKKEIKYIPVGQHDLKTLLITLSAQKKGISEIALTDSPDKLARWILIADWLKNQDPKIANDVDKVLGYLKMISAGRALKEKTTQDKELEALMSATPEDLGEILNRRAKSVTYSLD